MHVNRSGSEAPPQEAIAVEGFSVAYRADGELIPAISDVSFSLKPSERLAVVGESGSGKTTIATAIAGLLPASVARVEYSAARIAGRDVDMRPSGSVIPRSRDGVSMIFQDAMTSLDPVSTVGHQFRTVLDPAGRKGRAKVRAEAAEWIDRVGIPGPERVLKLHSYEMSGGMRQRVMIALALCSAPALLIADEPTSALDVAVSQRIMELILELTAEAGTAVIAITHDIDLARRYMDHTLVLYKGEAQDLCRTEELASSERSAYTQALTACVPRLTDHDRDFLPTLISETGAVQGVTAP